MLLPFTQNRLVRGSVELIETHIKRRIVIK
jgi:hypothetical protein